MERFNPPPFEADARGQNKKIRARILADDDMRALAFSDHVEGQWWYSQYVGERKYQILLSVSIPKDNPDGVRIDVIDDDFGQPYDYQNILREYPDAEVPNEIWIDVEKHMKLLSDGGVIVGHVYGEYI